MFFFVLCCVLVCNVLRERIKSCETIRVRPRVTAKGCDNDDDDVGNDNTTNDDTTFDHEGHVECDAIVCVCLFAPRNRVNVSVCVHVFAQNLSDGRHSPGGHPALAK